MALGLACTTMQQAVSEMGVSHAGLAGVAGGGTAGFCPPAFLPMQTGLG